MVLSMTLWQRDGDSNLTKPIVFKAVDEKEEKDPSTTTSNEVDHKDELCNDIAKLYFRSDLADITLKVDGESFPAHRIVLATRAEYFHGLLFGGLKESSSNIIDLGLDTPRHAFREIFRYIYTGKMEFREDQSNEEIFDILALSHKYQLIKLQDSIVDYVLSSILKLENVLKIFQINELYEYRKLQDGCESLIGKNASKILQKLELLSLSAKTVHNIISKDSFMANEIMIFSYAKEWCKMNPKASNVDRSLVLSGVRLYLIPKKDLLCTVMDSKLFSLSNVLDAINVQDKNRVNECRARFSASQEYLSSLSLLKFSKIATKDVD